MCLTIPLNRVSNNLGERKINTDIAEEDITVYKLYEINYYDSYRPKYVSPFANTYHILGKQEQVELTLDQDIRGPLVQRGYHSSNDINELLKYFATFKHKFNDLQIKRAVIIECIIPKGSKYIAGHSRGYFQIASNNLELVREVNFIEYEEFYKILKNRYWY